MDELDMEGMVQVMPLVDLKIIKETLSRMGIANKKRKVLYPTCYIYQNFDEFYIVHFKELFLITRPDGYNNLCQEDVERKNSILFCLKTWGLVDVEEMTIQPHDKYIFVLPHEEKHEWQIEHKFNMNSIQQVVE
tara:strand:- start:194 stop:595 length:402 start_codon:yes stop_codon:yes gene_type:complete